MAIGSRSERVGGRFEEQGHIRRPIASPEKGGGHPEGKGALGRCPGLQAREDLAGALGAPGGEVRNDQPVRFIAFEADLGPGDQPPAHLFEVLVHDGAVLKKELAFLVAVVQGFERVREAVFRVGWEDPEEAFGGFVGGRLEQGLHRHAEQHEHPRPVAPAEAPVLREARVGEAHPRQIEVEGLVLRGGRVRIPAHPEETPEGFPVPVGHRLDGRAPLFLGHQEGFHPAEFGDCGPASLRERGRRDGQQQSDQKDERHKGNLARRWAHGFRGGRRRKRRRCLPGSPQMLMAS